MTTSIAICTHNPVPAIFQRCLAGLRHQTGLPPQTELLIVDNVSDAPLPFKTSEFSANQFADIRVVREERLGLTNARHRALMEAKGDIVVFVDDDNILRPDFLMQTARFFSAHPQAGSIGGCCHGAYDITPPEWFDAVSGYLAVTHHGDKPFHVKEPSWWAPVGAGMAVRKEPALKAFARPMLLADRQGKSLSSGGDTEISYRICLQGYEIWYVPELRLDHFIPANRWELPYLNRLANGLGHSQAYLELYRLPEHLRTAFFFLRRAIYFGRKAYRLKRSAGRAVNQKEKIPAQLESVIFHRMSVTMLGLCHRIPKLRSSIV